MSLSEADRIAAAFATIPWPDHEARILALAYFALRRKLDDAEARLSVPERTT